MAVGIEAKLSNHNLFQAIHIEHPVEDLENEKVQNIAQKIFAALCHLIYQCIHRTIGLAVLPAQMLTLFSAEKILKKKALLKTNFGGEEFKIKTVDDVVLEGMYIPGKGCTKSDRTVILFNPNGVNFEEYGDNSLLFDIGLFNRHDIAEVEKGWNIVLFNYRGVAGSKGMATRDGLILDGEAIFQYIRDELGVPEKKILLHGHSLGGGVASEVAANHPETNCCNDRSFVSLSKEVKVMFGNGKFGEFLSNLLVYFGWEFNTRDHWDKIKGKKIVVLNDRDGVIPSGARLHEFLGIEEKNWMNNGIIDMVSLNVQVGVNMISDSPAYIDQLLLKEGISENDKKNLEKMKNQAGQIAHMRKYSEIEELQYIIEIEDI